MKGLLFSNSKHKKNILFVYRGEYFFNGNKINFYQFNDDYLNNNKKYSIYNFHHSNKYNIYCSAHINNKSFGFTFRYEKHKNKINQWI